MEVDKGLEHSRTKYFISLFSASSHSSEYTGQRRKGEIDFKHNYPIYSNCDLLWISNTCKSLLVILEVNYLRYCKHLNFAIYKFDFFNFYNL